MQGQDLTQGGILRNLVRLSLPIMLSNFVQTVYNATDAWWLGKLDVGARQAVAATGIAFPLVFFISSFGVGFMIAGTALISRYRGSDQPDKIKEVTGQFIFLLALVLPVFFVGSQALLGVILKMMSVPTDVLPHASGYMRLVLAGMGFNFLFLAFQSFSHGLGDTVTPMKVLVSTVLLNIVLDPFLIFGVGPFPAMGTVGAGLATMFARFLAGTASIFVVARRYRSILPRWGGLRPNGPVLRTIFGIALPASVAQSITSFGFMVLIGFVNSYQAAVIAVYTINNRIMSMFMLPAMGISNGLSAIVGQCLGAGDRKRARDSVGVALLLVMAILITGASMMFFFGETLVRFFLDDNEVIVAGQRMFRIVCWATFFFGTLFVFFGVFNGSGYTWPTMALNITRLWLLRIPLTYLLSGRIAQYITWERLQPFFAWAARPLAQYPYDALWWSMLISNVVCIIIAGAIYLRGDWQWKRV